MITKIYDEISDEELAAMTNAIKNRYGIDFTSYEKKSLKRGFARLMGKNDMGSLLELWKVILNDKAFFIQAIDDLTVNLTELFRNPEIWEILDNDILEQFKHKPIINIWHAGCSTGEEVYSMGMVLENKGVLQKTRSLATDISASALEKARKGSYSKQLVGKYEKTFKKYLPNATIGDMFHLDNGNATIKERFQRNVEFRHFNLVSDVSERKFDVIFCRNVMIYFDDNLKMQVIKKLLNSLNPGGYLVVGFYDMLPDSSRELITQYDSHSRIYTAKKTISMNSTDRLNNVLKSKRA